MDTLFKLALASFFIIVTIVLADERLLTVASCLAILKL